MNKKGDFTGILFLIVMVAAFAFFLLVVGYVTPKIMNPLKTNLGISEEINDSFQSGTNLAHNTLNTIWMIMFGGLFLGLIATAWFVPSHPIFTPIFILLLVITFIVAIPLSNAYESLTQTELSEATAYQGMINFFMLNLPLVSAVIGILIMIISFAKPSYSGGGYVPA